MLLLLSVAGCGAEAFRANGAADASVPNPIGSGGTPVLVPDGSGGVIDAGMEITGSGGAGGSPIHDAGVGGAGGVAGVDAADIRPTLDVTAAETAPAAPFECNQIIGLFVANQWWPTFQAALDSAHWQLLYQTGAYVELWADPAYQYWNKAVTSPCTTRSQDPDRVLLIVYSTVLDTLAEFRTNINRAIATVQMKYPGVRRIELLTSVRGPGNQLCPGAIAGTVVAPYVDQAIQEAAAASMGKVTVGPKIEVKDCAWWQAASTNLTTAGAVGVGEAYAAYYKDRL